LFFSRVLHSILHHVLKSFNPISELSQIDLSAFAHCSIRKTIAKKFHPHSNLSGDQLPFNSSQIPPMPPISDFRVFSLEFAASSLPLILFLISKSCLIRAVSGAPAIRLINSAIGTTFIYHIIAIYIRHVHGKFVISANMDLPYLVRAVSLIFLNMYPTLFFFSSTLLYFALTTEFIHYQLAPKCASDGKLHIQLFTERILHSSYFSAVRAFTEFAMAFDFLKIAVQESRWDVGIVAVLHFWLFGIVAYSADVGHRCLWSIVRGVLGLDQQQRTEPVGTRIRMVASQCRLGPISLCQC
jgi:hypothetical protein